MLYSIRSKIIASLVGVSLLVGVVSLGMGGHLLYGSVVAEATDRVRQDLNVARLLYRRRIETARMLLDTCVAETDFRGELGGTDLTALRNRLTRMAERTGLDFAGVASLDGQILARIGAGGNAPPVRPGTNPAALLALKKGESVSGTVVLDPSTLAAENPALAQRAAIAVRPPGNGGTFPPIEENAGLTLSTAVPIRKGNELLGVVYGGVLLNRDDDFVDHIARIVFGEDANGARAPGTTTIFFRDLRVATNVRDAAGRRVLGSRASKAVADHVLGGGGRWIDRAFVFDEWHITAYEPITDLFGERVGMLYVGVPEAKYTSLRERAFGIFILITLAGGAAAVILGIRLAQRILRPVNRLIHAGAEISRGNLSPEIGPISKSDIGQLQRQFLEMTHALKERGEQERVERERCLLQSEKQAAVGKLAAGVAHEINNPLTAVLTYTCLMRDLGDELPPQVREDLEVVAQQTQRVRRIVQDLLDLSRQSPPIRVPVSLDSLVGDTVRLLENQALVQGVALTHETEPDLPLLELDRQQMQGVLVNLILNAMDASQAGGVIQLTSRPANRNGRKGAEVLVRDYGSGIAEEHLEQLFDPFFTTKEVGKGTGLGLAVSAGIVERHDGEIDVASVVGEGTTFTVWLPEAAETEAESENLPREEDYACADRG
ncbi:MAG: cache domain-containing protein [Desulfococcaceae bacterium]